MKHISILAMLLMISAFVISSILALLSQTEKYFAWSITVQSQSINLSSSENRVSWRYFQKNSATDQAEDLFAPTNLLDSLYSAVIEAGDSEGNLPTDSLDDRISSISMESNASLAQDLQVGTRNEIIDSSGIHLQKNSSSLTGQVIKEQLVQKKTGDPNTANSGHERGVMAVVTVATSQDIDALMLLISQIRKTSGLVQVIVFDSGLSDSDKKNIGENVACEIRPIPESHGSCKAPCKPHLVHSVILTHKVIVWMDVGYVQEWDLRLILDGVSVGTSFFGSLSKRDIHPPKKVAKDKTIKVVSVEFFVMIVEVRFFNRVLLPWKQCAENRDIISSHLLIHGDIPLETLGSDAGHDVTLTALLRSYEALYPGSVLTNVKKGKSPFGSALYKGDEDPALRKIRNGSAVSLEPFLATVPFFGPNNQLIMVLHSALMVARQGTRILIPPLRKHSLKTDRANVSQDSPSIPADHFLSPHFLYRRGVLADKDSSWTELLPQVDFIIAEMDPKRNKALGFPPWRPCTHNNTCKVRDLMDNLYTTAFFQSIGMHRESKSSINVIECSGTPEECIQSSLVKRGRIAMLFWCTVGLLRVNKDKYPGLSHAPFSVPAPLIERGFSHPNACMAVHLRLKDTVQSGIPELLNAPCKDLMSENFWGKRTLAEAIQLLLRAASHRGLSRPSLLALTHRTACRHVPRRECG